MPTEAWPGKSTPAVARNAMLDSIWRSATTLKSRLNTHTPRYLPLSDDTAIPSWMGLRRFTPWELACSQLSYGSLLVISSRHCILHLYFGLQGMQFLMHLSLSISLSHISCLVPLLLFLFAFLSFFYFLIRFSSFLLCFSFFLLLPFSLSLFFIVLSLSLYLSWVSLPYPLSTLSLSPFPLALPLRQALSRNVSYLTVGGPNAHSPSSLHLITPGNSKSIATTVLWHLVAARRASHAGLKLGTQTS